ncbi:MAG: histone-like nucleoid-structuring protein Lsr2 [Armatimonadia bacterium]
MAQLTDHTPDDDDTYPPADRELVEPSQPTPKAIRAWALEKGLVVGKRGKLPADVVLAYQEATRS